MSRCHPDALAARQRARGRRPTCQARTERTRATVRDRRPPAQRGGFSTKRARCSG